MASPVVRICSLLPERASVAHHSRRKCERDIVVSDEVTLPFLDVVATRKWLGHAVVLRAASSAVDMAKVGWP